MTKCFLCEKEKKLIDAHVIPKWAFRHLYPEDPESKRQSLVLVSKEGQIRRPIGPYDSDILCAECDNLLGNYDSYAKTIFLDRQLKIKNELSYIIEDVDFHKLQLFLVSVFWRASISNKIEFERVSIGPYENRIKPLLLDPGKISLLENYEFIVTKFDEGELPQDVVNKNVQIPHTQKIGGVNVGVLYLPRGLKIFLKLDQRNFPTHARKLSQYRQEGLIVARLGNYSDSLEFKSMLDIV